MSTASGNVCSIPISANGNPPQRLQQLETQYGYALVGLDNIKNMDGSEMNCPANLAVYQGVGNMRRKQEEPPPNRPKRPAKVELPKPPPPPKSSSMTQSNSGTFEQNYPDPPPPVQPLDEPTETRNSTQNIEEAAANLKSALDATLTESKGWDIFRTLPPLPDSFGQGFWIEVSLQALKILTYVVLFCLILGSAFIAKTTFLLMTSAVGWGSRNTTICRNPTLESAVNSTVLIEHKHVVKWIWALYITICLPELFSFVRCLHRVTFRNVKKPTIGQFFTVFIVETLHSVGVGLLVFRLFPNLDAVTGAMLSNCFCFIPALLSLLSRKPGKIAIILVIFDIFAIAAQSSGFWAWPMFFPELAKETWAVPVALTLISVAWWPNFVHTDSVFPFIRSLARHAAVLHQKRSKTYVLVNVWKCIIYLITLFIFTSSRISIEKLLEPEPFGMKPIIVIVRGFDPQEVFELYTEQRRALVYEGAFTTPDPDWLTTNKLKMTTHSQDKAEVIDANEYNERRKREIVEQHKDYIMQRFYTTPYDALWLVLVQVLSVILCYQCGKFACKVMMQRLTYALPLALVIPLTVLSLIGFCSGRHDDPCYFSGSMPYELFWRCYKSNTTFQQFFTSPQTWIWFTWLLSQLWITIHLWRPQCERLASGERLFVLPWYCGAFIDQSLAMNRRRDDKAKVRTEDIELEGEDASLYETIPGLGVVPKSPASLCSQSTSCKSANLIRDTASAADSITKIYACATMWHESPIEMTCVLKSIFRLDEDQCARRNAQKYLKIIDPDYYEFEAHIFFDDAFEMNDYGEPVPNKFFRQLLEKMDHAASAVHQTQMRLKPPKKYATPYGGRMMWILPGKNKMTIHLKDKSRIRHRKRWSQVMYMYHLLGYRLMQKVEDQQRKELISENTYILTLDGDVDFKPSSVHLLVDLMKKNRRLGAACGRIHPRGSGMMMWYQKFEYAIGHWLQKATEHLIGCVLCAPGCFSLFRSCALMDDNVAKRYASKSENPKDYIQYDQGEDRWLCTLLLQRGYRVEYCAASDALTFAPESFNEFFNQRRRWIPSTLANVIDILVGYKNIIKVNDSISIWYILYQFVMLISSILGPGTIFLMVVGAISISFNIDTTLSFVIVLLPVAFFSIVCLSCKPSKQLVVAQVTGSLFAMLMTAVIVGTALQIKKDGIYSPHAVFLFAVITSFTTSAILHPLEFTCIIPGILYFMAIPCMYMLLPIYSVCNLHVVSWGTREDPKIDDGIKHKQKNRKHNFNLNILDGQPEDPFDVDGVYSVGCGNVCRFLCCVQPSAIANSSTMHRISQQLHDINKRMERVDRRATRSSLALDQRHWEQATLLNEDDESSDDNFDLGITKRQSQKEVSDAWLDERYLLRAEKDELEPEETNFWKELIDKYLYPVRMDRKETERVQQGLVELRNKVSFGFFMMNALFILIVFLLQLKKDCLHIEWPFGPKHNQSIVPCDDSEVTEEIWVLTRLQLEPLGLVFLIFFMSILVIQFGAMLLHRLGTLAHIIASTELFCYRKPVDKLSEDELVVQNAVEIAKELQAIRGVDESSKNLREERTISRRRVVQNLESSRRSMMHRRTETLDAAFRKRFFALNSDSQITTPVLGSREKRLTMRKGTIKALENRRDSTFGTMDRNSSDKQNNSETEADKSWRGPAQRRLDKLFQEKEKGKTSSTDIKENGASSSDEEIKIPHPGMHRAPIRKLISQAVWDENKRVPKDRLLESGQSHGNTPPEAHF